MTMLELWQSGHIPAFALGVLTAFIAIRIYRIFNPPAAPRNESRNESRNTVSSAISSESRNAVSSESRNAVSSESRNAVSSVINPDIKPVQTPLFASPNASVIAAITAAVNEYRKTERKE